MIYLPNDKKARIFLAVCNNAKIYTDVLLRKGTDLSMYKRHLCHVQTVSVQDTNADLWIVTLRPLKVAISNFWAPKTEES